jgi:predicted ATPase/DNA-binding SARP family transcriptional activator
MTLAFQFLGPPQLRVENEPVNVNRRSIVALLAYLSVDENRPAGRRYTRESLSGLLWPDSDQVKAFTNLRHILWEIQKIFGPGWLLADRETISLRPDANIWVDVHRFGSLLLEGRQQSDVSLRIPLLEECVKLYRHHFLTGFNLKGAPTFDEWALAKADDLRNKHTEALTLLAEDYCLLGNAASALQYARRLVTLDPLNESAHRLLMEVYSQVGQHNAALKQYQTFEQALRKELGIDPKPETRALYKQIRKGELKPIQRTVESARLAPRNNLPQQLTSFIGREKEQADTIKLISKHRLVTLTGSGGVGKTRLSLQVGEQILENFAEGIWLVELAPILDPLLVPRATAIAIGLRDEPQRPVIDMLSDYLREKQILLVLDNCEHLLDACAQLAGTLLKRCPGLKILATSREILGMLGEAVYRVPSLALPNIPELLKNFRQYESIRLFEERAQLIQTNFSLTVENVSSVAEICIRLDGIPLAIELAAARISSFSAEQIAVLLKGNFSLLTTGNRTALPRHQTLQAVIDWSYDLLSPAEQTLFPRLSVFVDGWTAEAAESICSDTNIQPDVMLEMLSGLTNKSLVIVEEIQSKIRYRMLETVRQYAKKKLVESGENDILRDRHLAYFLKLAETAEPHLIGPEQIEWLPLLDSDYGNIRFAFEWSMSTKMAESALNICHALCWFWIIRGYWMEGSTWVKSALTITPQNDNTDVKVARLRAFRTDATLNWQLGNYEQMLAAAEASRGLALEVSNNRDIAIATFLIAYAWKLRGAENDNQALSLFDQCLSELQDLNEPFWQARCYRELGHLLSLHAKLKFHELCITGLELARKAGERLTLAEALYIYADWLMRINRTQEAITYIEESDKLYEQIGAQSNSFNSFVLAEIAWKDGDFQKARSLYFGKQEQMSVLGELDTFSLCKAKLSLLAIEDGDLNQAQRYLDGALRVSREMENKPSIALRLAEMGNLYYLQGDLEKSKENFRESLSFKNYFDKVQKACILMAILGSLYLQWPEVSAHLLGAVDHYEKESDIPLLQSEKRYWDRAEIHTRKTLGSEGFEVAFAEGQRMSLDEVLALALKTVTDM